MTQGIVFPKIKLCFKIALFSAGWLSVNAAARDLEICSTSLGRWVKQYEIDHGEGPAGAMTSREKEELRRLRRENRQLLAKGEILGDEHSTGQEQRPDEQKQIQHRSPAIRVL